MHKLDYFILSQTVISSTDLQTKLTDFEPVKTIQIFCKVQRSCAGRKWRRCYQPQYLKNSRFTVELTTFTSWVLIDGFIQLD